MQNVYTETVTTWTIDDHPDPGAVFDYMRQNWQDLYGWQPENRDSLMAFADHFSLSDLYWEVSTCRHSYAEAKVYDDGYSEKPLSEMAGVRLWKYLNNSGLLTYYRDGKRRDLLGGECPFTGYCFDENLLDPIREFIARPDSRTFQDLIDECLTAWVSAYVADWEYAYSDEGLAERCEASGYEFTETGEFYG